MRPPLSGKKHELISQDYSLQTILRSGPKRVVKALYSWYTQQEHAKILRTNCGLPLQQSYYVPGTMLEALVTESNKPKDNFNMEY